MSDKRAGTALDHPVVPRPLPESLSDASNVLERIEVINTEDPYARCESFEDCCKVMFDTNTAMRKFFGKQ